MSAVLDASVTLSWCFADQASPATDLLLDPVRDHGTVVPTLWFVELGSVLLNAERRGRITAADGGRRLERISALPILVDQAGTGRAWTEILDLARAKKLTVYDACWGTRQGGGAWRCRHEKQASGRFFVKKRRQKTFILGPWAFPTAESLE